MGAAIANSDVIWMVMKSSNECSGVGDFVENIPVKIMILNDQYLGMVAQ
jgi:thiamine pyrophosphate-dependent acetolactate synthase large subunit-like protein